MSHYEPLPVLDSGSGGGWVRGNAPAELFVGLVVPQGHQADGDQVGEVAIHVQPIELDIQDHDVKEDAERADGVELQEALDALPHGVLMPGNRAKGPQVVPDKIVEKRGLGRQQLASRQAPAQHFRVAEDVQQGHVDHHSGAADHAKAEEAGHLQQVQAQAQQMLEVLDVNAVGELARSLDALAEGVGNFADPANL